jgi:hypothetical protein
MRDGFGYHGCRPYRADAGRALPNIRYAADRRSLRRSLTRERTQRLGLGTGDVLKTSRVGTDHRRRARSLALVRPSFGHAEMAARDPAGSRKMLRSIDLAVRAEGPAR